MSDHMTIRATDAVQAKLQALAVKYGYTRPMHGQQVGDVSALIKSIAEEGQLIERHWTDHDEQPQNGD